MNPIRLEIVAPMLSGVEMSCRGCGMIFNSLGLKKQDRNGMSNEYPEDWKDAIGQLSQWVNDLTRLYRHRLNIHIIDAQSPLGLWKQLRYRTFKFPAFIVEGESKYIGWDPQELEAIIDSYIRDGI